MNARFPAVSLLMTMTSMLMTRQTAAFSSGAPAYICRTMRPGHTNSPVAIDDSFPFTIRASNYLVQPGDVVDISVSSKKPGEEFQGMLAVSTKLEDGNAEIVTGMVPIDPGSATKTINCMTGNDQAVPLSGVTHTHKMAASEIEFHWTAPPTAVPGSTYQIKVVIVQSFYVCWEPVVLTIMIRNSNGQTSSENTTTTVSRTSTKERITTSNPPSAQRSALSPSTQDSSNVTTAPSPPPVNREMRTSFAASSAMSSNSNSTTTSSSPSPTTVSLDVQVGRNNQTISNNRRSRKLSDWLSSLFG